MKKLLIKLTIIVAIVAGVFAVGNAVPSKEVASGFTTFGADPGGGR